MLVLTVTKPLDSKFPWAMQISILTVALFSLDVKLASEFTEVTDSINTLNACYAQLINANHFTQPVAVTVVLRNTSSLRFQRNIPSLLFHVHRTKPSRKANAEIVKSTTRRVFSWANMFPPGKLVPKCLFTYSLQRVFKAAACNGPKTVILFKV